MKKIFLVILSLLIMLPLFASADGIVSCGNTGQEPCKLSDFITIFTNINTIIKDKIAPGLAIIFLIIGGLQILFSAGNPEMFGTGKKILITTIIGLILVYGALAIINWVLSAIGAHI